MTVYVSQELWCSEHSACHPCSIDEEQAYILYVWVDLGFFEHKDLESMFRSDAF